MRGNAIVLGLVTLLTIWACNSSPTAPDNGLDVQPATAAMTAGNSVQLTVIGPDGATMTEGVTWRSAAPHIVAVSASGLATAMYDDGTVTITASFAAETGEALVTALSACAAPAPLEGTPPVQPEISQAFEVRFDEGVDVAKRAQELAQQIGFRVTEITEDGFIATLTVTQVGTVRCVFDVAGLTFI
jgi:hypothetical protein